MLHYNGETTSLKESCHLVMCDFGQVTWLHRASGSLICEMCVITPVLTIPSAGVRAGVLYADVREHSARPGGRLNCIKCKA